MVIPRLATKDIIHSNPFFIVEFEFTECSENHFGKTQLLLQVYITDLKLFFNDCEW